MALVIENGSIVPGANTYISVDELRDFATDRGVTLPTEDSELEPMIILAADFINSYEPDFRGKRMEFDQPMAWPRQEVKIYGTDFPNNAIPSQLKSAQSQAAILVVTGVDLMPNITGYAVRREKVDVIEVEYATGGGLNNSATPELTPVFPIIASLLAPLLDYGQAGLLKVYRA